MARPSLPQATVRLAIVVLLSLSRLAVALLTVRLTVVLATDWQLSLTAKRPLRSAERVRSREGTSSSAANGAGRVVDGAWSTVGATIGIATVNVCDW